MFPRPSRAPKIPSKVLVTFLTASYSLVMVLTVSYMLVMVLTARW